MKYGLPYMGSKNRLAERIVKLLPEGDCLVDLFCGGCAVTHAAILSGKYPHVHINDADWRPVALFRDALAGKYQEEDRWISREDFFRLKDTDPYVAIVWSFGNNMRDYLYSRRIEPLKRAIHFAIFYGDYEPARELGYDLSFVDSIKNIQERYLAVKQYLRQAGRFEPFLGGVLCRIGGSNAHQNCSTKKPDSVYSTWMAERACSPFGGAETSYYRLQHLEAQQRLLNSGEEKWYSVGGVSMPITSGCSIAKDTIPFPTFGGYKLYSRLRLATTAT